MYRPSMYNKHDESMYAFAELFNNCKVCNDVIMKPNDEETYGNDGYFIHSNGQKIGYDWEYRDRYFSNCRLQFDTLGQYERKLRKDVFVVAETKGTMESLQLRPIEQAKIMCARKLFNEISTDNVVYHDVDSYQSLLNILYLQ